MGNGETYFTKAETDSLFLAKKIQNFPYAANYVNLYNKHLYTFIYDIYVITLQIAFPLLSCLALIISFTFPVSNFWFLTTWQSGKFFSNNLYKNGF